MPNPAICTGKMMKTYIACLLFLPLVPAGLHAQENFRLLSPERLYPAIVLDPLESQVTGTSVFLSGVADSIGSHLSSVSLGINQPLLTRSTGNLSWEICFEAASFTQFEIARISEKTLRGSLLNNDYKVGASAVFLRENWLLKLGFFHRSSHLGDDYLIRKQIFVPNDKSASYEQVDLVIMKTSPHYHVYAGLAEVVSTHAYRKRFSFMGGGSWNPGSGGKAVGFFSSGLLKSFAENGFYPDLRLAAGLTLARGIRSKLWLELYHGHLPYSTLDYGKLSWVGVGMCLGQ